MNNFKDKLEELVRYLDTTMKDMAKELGISDGYFYAVFKGTISSEKVVFKLSRKYGIDEEYFSNNKPISFYIEKPKTQKERKIETGLRLKEARNNKGISQIKLAKMIGVTEKLISAIEVGRVRLVDSKAETIADVLDVDKDWLLYGEEYRKRYPINERMIKWLNEHEEIRKDLWIKLKAETENENINF